MIYDRHTPSVIALAGTALLMLQEEIGPELITLLYNPRIPEAHLATLLDWSELLDGDNPLPAFALEFLPELLHALNIALLSSCAFAAAPPRPGVIVPPGRVDLDVSDLGGALVVDRARTCALVIIAAIHGDQGIAIVRASNAEFTRLMNGISAAVAKAR